MGDVVKLVCSQELPIKVCGTCRHYKIDPYGIVRFSACHALSVYAHVARETRCNRGQLWEPKPPRVPFLRKIKEWLIG